MIGQIDANQPSIIHAEIVNTKKPVPIPSRLKISRLICLISKNEVSHSLVQLGASRLLVA
jgi:hypothetical protein